MSLPNDPMMLFSFINMKLRDNYSSLDDLCEDLQVNKKSLLTKLKDAGFECVIQWIAYPGRQGCLHQVSLDIVLDDLFPVRVLRILKSRYAERHDRLYLAVDP